MPIENKQQLYSIQAGRGVASVLVVALHSSGYFNFDTRYWNRHDLFHYLDGCRTGVEYFFVLSGAVIMIAHWKDIGKPETIRRYVGKRFRRIYPIYWIILTILVLEYSLRPGLGASYQTDPFVILSGYLLVHIKVLGSNLPSAWTLYHEVLFYAVFAILLFSKRLGALVLALWCLLSIYTSVISTNDYLSRYLFAPIHLLFPMGMVVGWLIRTRRLSASSVLTILGIIIFGIAYVMSGHASVETPNIQWLSGLGAALTILGAAGLELNSKLRIPASLQFLGDASYSIYLIHWPFLMFVTPFIYKLSMRIPVPMPLLLLSMISAGVLVGCLTHLYVERPLLNYLDKTRPTRATAASAS